MADDETRAEDHERAVAEVERQFAETSANDDAIAAITAKSSGSSAPAETADVEEVVAEETAPEPEATPELILGKYKTTEDALAALEESQSHIGRLANELGERRQRETELTSRLEQLERPRQQEDLDSLMFENPRLAAERAAQLGDDYRFQQAIEQWNIAEPGVPKMWLESQQLRQAVIELNDRVAQQTAPALNLAIQAEQQQALKNLSARYEDFEQVRDALLDDERLAEVVKESFPTQLLEGLDNQVGVLAQREQMLATLYHFAKAKQAGSLPQAVAAAAAQVKNDTVGDKIAATVPMSSTGTPEPVGRSEADVLRNNFRLTHGMPPLFDNES